MQQVEKNEREQTVSRTVPEDIKKKIWKKLQEDEESSGKNNK